MTDDTSSVKNNDPNSRLLEPSWMNQWKEVLAYVFSAIIAFDFIVAPSAIIIIDAIEKTNIAAWQPLTLQSGGLFYISMAAILSVAGYGSMIKSRELIRNLSDSSK